MGAMGPEHLLVSNVRAALILKQVVATGLVPMASPKFPTVRLASGRTVLCAKELRACGPLKVLFTSTAAVLAEVNPPPQLSIPTL